MEYLALGMAGLALAAAAEVCAVLALLLWEARRPRGEAGRDGVCGEEERRTGGEERLMSAAEGFDNLMRYSVGAAEREGHGFEHGMGGL